VISPLLIFLFIAPVVSFAILAWVALCLLFGFAGQEQTATSMGLLAFLSAGVCTDTARRLYPRRALPEFRALFLLNVAGVAGILSWFARSLLSAAWQYLIPRAPL
jgi:hypothetical protein